MRLCVLFCLFLHFILNVNSYEVTKLTGHTDKIVGLALHTKSGVFASVSHDKTVKVWDIKSEKLLRSFTGFNSWVESISISPNGKNIIVGLWDGEIRILDITTGKMLKSLQYHQGSVKVLEFSADESVFVSAGDDGIIRIWNSITWELMTTLKGHNYSVSSVKFSDNGRLMITSSIDETIKIWDIDTKKCLNTLKGHKAMVTNAFFVDDEKYIVSTSVDKTIKIWDWKSNKLIQSIVAHSAPIYASNYFKTQNQITTTSEDGSIKIWQYPAMEQIDSFNMKSRAIFTLVLDSNVIITAGIDSAISMIKKTHRDDLISSIKNYVEMKINTWQKKGEYEKIADYQNRVSVITRQKMIQEYTDEAIAIFKKEYLSKLTITEMKLGSYDADNESYLLSLSSKKSVALKVPLAEAKSLKEHWDKVIIAFADATIVNDFFEITKITFRNSITNKTYSYDSNITTKYVASNIQYNFDDIKVNVSSDSVSTKSDISVTTVTLGKSDVSINIPVTKTTNPDAIAVIIGNKDYKKTKAVDFALNDAQLMKEYLIKIFGYKEGNIFFVQNANKGDFEMYFGNESNHKGKLFNSIKPGQSDVFIYYVGHGAPSMNSKKGYFVPIESDPKYVDITGYSIDTFYLNIAKIPSRSITVVLDACFSGADLIKDVSPMIIEINNPILTLDNTVVFSSSSGQQLSTWYNEKGHSTFTYFFLKGIHSKKADKDNNGIVTVKELFDFVSDNSEGVPYVARRFHNLEQTPTVESKDKERILVTY